MLKIIVPTDFSDTSVDALRYGYYLSDLTGYELEAVHVHDGYDGEEGLVIKKGSARIRSRVRERLEKFVALHADQVSFAGTHDDDDDDVPHIKSREVIGMAIGQLVKLSKQEDVALIVMGGVNTGIPSAVTPIFGSVAKGVATLAGCPVLLIPPNTGVPKIKHAAIVFDEAETLVGLSEKTEFLHKALAPTIHFTHVLHREETSEEMMDLELVHEILDRDFPNHTVEFDLLPEGNVTSALIDYSLKRDIDLMILGRRHSRGYVMNLMFKSHIPDIVGSCGIPMLIIPLNE